MITSSKLHDLVLATMARAGVDAKPQYGGTMMDRKRNERRRCYRETTYCETHKRTLDKCRYGDATCAVCGCGGLCDSKLPCPMQRRPLP